MKQSLLRLNPRKASGPDGIPPWLLKQCADDLAPVVTHLVNYSYQLGVVPIEWKAANICPVPKVSNPSQTGDWRPISLTSCLGKVQEKFVLKKLMPTALGECKNQHAYLPGHSTTTALVKATHTWLTQTDSCNAPMVRILLADMSKAFDRVDHAKLLQHLATLDLCPQLLTWLHSYTIGRRQRVVANSIYSTWKDITSGVPQGGVIAPYLFLLHMSSRSVLFDDTLDIGYADDIGLSRAIRLSDIGNDTSMEREARQLEEWAAANNMLLNGKKSVELRVCFAKDPPQPPPLILDGQVVPVVTSTKYLGFYLDNQLSGDVHIEEAVKKASKRLHFLTVMARNGLPVEDLVDIYNTLIRPCLEYGSVLLVGCKEKQRATIDRVQKRAVKIMTRFKDIPLHFPDLQTRREQATVKLIKDMHQPNHPLHNILPPSKGERTGRLLRKNNQLTLPKTRTNRLRNSTISCGVRLFNNL